MPYLHWEFDRRREQVSRHIYTESDKHKRENLEDSQAEKKKRREGRKTLPSSHMKANPIRHKLHNTPNPRRVATDLAARLQTIADSAHQRWTEEKEKQGKDNKDKDVVHVYPKPGRLISWDPLGQYLLDAARLYEAMATYRERSLIRQYLHAKAPLHPHRTLDQAYYWALKNTRERDRGQVVYRGTASQYKLRHSLHRTDNKVSSWWIKPSRWLQDIRPSEPSPRLVALDHEPVRPPGVWEWSRHGTNEDEHGCQQCSSNIRKSARVVMVDQLWMWILDSNTILTLFPRRYGMYRRDSTDVHRAIRSRLARAKANTIRSVFDLALIILDECTWVFSDRTKVATHQPEVMDIFAEAIGNVVGDAPLRLLS
jgi:hypothetical protein